MKKGVAVAAGGLGSKALADDTVTLTLGGVCTGCFINDATGDAIPGTCFDNPIDEMEVTTSLELTVDLQGYKAFKGEVELVDQCLPEFPNAPFTGALEVLKQNFDGLVYYTLKAQISMGQSEAPLGSGAFGLRDLERFNPFYIDGVKTRIEGESPVDVEMKPRFYVIGLTVE